MKVYIHKLVVEVATLDANPASVAATIDGALSDLRTDHPKGRILTTNTEPTGNESREATIPDEPTEETGRAILGRPYTGRELDQATDDWWNNFVHELFRQEVRR